MPTLPTAERNALPARSFALPALRKFPIHDAPHVRAALSRLPQAKGLTPAQRRTALANVKRAAKRFGVEVVSSDGGAPTQDNVHTPGAMAPPRRKGLHFRLTPLAAGGHQIDVMHASDAGERTVHGEGIDVAPLTLDDSLTGRASALWNQLNKIGMWRGHSSGPFEITPEINNEIVRNFKSTINQRIPIDFEHASEEEPAAGSIPTEGAPAQGWIHELDNRGAGGLWGLVEWLEPARTYIRQKKYRYFSPAIRFGARDRVTGQPIGARMTSGALTNSPFLDGLMPLAASDRSTDQDAPMLDRPMMSSSEFMPRCRSALKMGLLATPTECKAEVGRLRTYCEMADAPSQTPMGIPLADYLQSLHDMMGLGANATAGELLDAVEEMIEAAIAEHVAEMHPALNDDNDEGGAEMADRSITNTENTTMADEKIAALLADEKTRTTSLSTENAALSLRLRDAEATAAERLAKATELEATVVTLRDEAKKRDDDAATEKVTMAFETYKDSKKLTDDDREAMAITLRSKPALFDKLYPPVPGAQRHLQRNLTADRTPSAATGGGRGAPPVSAPGADGGPVLDHNGQKLLADRLVKERKMGAQEANTLAFKVAMGSQPHPFTAS